MQDSSQGLEADSDIDEVRGEEEMVYVAEHRHDEVPEQIKERLKAERERESDASRSDQIIFLLTLQ